MIDIYNRLGSDTKYIPALETEDGIEQILAQVKMVLGTSRGEVLGNPEFGADIKQYLFSLSYDQNEIREIIKSIITTAISYDTDKYKVDIDIEFGKDIYNKSDYAVINVKINEIKYLGIIMNQ